MALALNNLKRVDMPLNKETKPNQTKINNKKLFLLKLSRKYWIWSLPRVYINSNLKHTYTHTHTQTTQTRLYIYQKGRRYRWNIYRQMHIQLENRIWFLQHAKIWTSLFTLTSFSIWWNSFFLSPFPENQSKWTATIRNFIVQSAGAVEYTDCFSAEE